MVASSASPESLRELFAPCSVGSKRCVPGVLEGLRSSCRESDGVRIEAIEPSARGGGPSLPLLYRGLQNLACQRREHREDCRCAWTRRRHPTEGGQNAARGAKTGAAGVRNGMRRSAYEPARRPQECGFRRYWRGKWVRAARTSGGGGIRTRFDPKHPQYTNVTFSPQIATFGPKNAVLTNRSRHKASRAKTRQNTN